jgi:hypothetical protein
MQRCIKGLYSSRDTPKSFGRTYKHIQQDDAGAGDAASDPLKMEDQS